MYAANDDAFATVFRQIPRSFIPDYRLEVKLGNLFHK
jgi:hypothetical protein